MPLKDEYLRRANLLVNSLIEEQIDTPEHCEDKIKTRQLLNFFREAVHKLAESYPVPGLTGCVAVTLLKIAACQELAQRFSLDYFLTFDQSNVSLIFVGNPGTIGQQGDNHTFVLIGPVLTSDRLLVGRGATASTLSGDGVLISDFLMSQNKDSVIADPLLRFSSPVHESCEILMDYCRTHDITHVVGIKSYDVPGVVEAASEIKRNAEHLANQVMANLPAGMRALLQTSTSVQAHRLYQPASDAHQSLVQKVAKHVQRCPKHVSCLSAIEEKQYGLALRKASAVGALSLVSIISNYISNHSEIAAQMNESSPTTGKNALDLAYELSDSVKNKNEIIELLIQHGATATQVPIETSNTDLTRKY